MIIWHRIRLHRSSHHFKVIYVFFIHWFTYNKPFNIKEAWLRKKRRGKRTAYKISRFWILVSHFLKEHFHILFCTQVSRVAIVFSSYMYSPADDEKRLANVIFCSRANVTCTRSRELFCSKTTGKVSIARSISHGKHEEIFHDNKILVMQVDLHSNLPGDGSSDTYVMPNFKIDLSEISSVRKCVWFKTENISKKVVKRLYCFSLNIF